MKRWKHGGVRASLAVLDARKTVGKILEGAQVKRKKHAYSRSYRRGLRLV